MKGPLNRRKGKGNTGMIRGGESALGKVRNAE